MRKYTVQIIILFAFFALVWTYFNINFGFPETDKVFITITTFFFSIFTGYFITRQGNRYTKIRETISTFDGKLSSIYRISQNISPKIHQEIGEIIKKHYVVIIENKKWNYHLTRKSDTLTSIHDLLENSIGDKKEEALRTQSIGRVVACLSDCQSLRKNMVMLYQEKIPAFHWLLIFFFVFIILATVSIIPSIGLMFSSILKSAFVISIITIVIILHDLDNFNLFEEFIGASSAEDVVNIIHGSK